MVASPPWFDLDDIDPRKWAAVLSAAEHWVLRIESFQETVGRPNANAEASHAISAAFDWSKIANAIRRANAARRSPVYIPRVVA